MTELTCRYSGDREDAIVSYLYDEADADARAAFEAHLRVCAQCRAEVSGYEGVRSSIGQWMPPEPAGMVGRHGPSDANRRAWWRDMPVWAQVAAAMLVLGVAAGVAHLDVRYDANGLRVRTGWSSAADASAARSNPRGDAPWRAELTALEQRLRAEARQPDTPATSAPLSTPGTVANDATPDTLRRVRALVEESERRQQRELALRLAEAMRDINAQRQSDLGKIDRSIGAMQNSTGLEILRTRETINDINNYIVRTSSQRPQ
jgi:hypothetical protein